MFFFFNDTATTEIYTLSLHDALPIYLVEPAQRGLLTEVRPDRDGADEVEGPVLVRERRGGRGDPRREDGRAHARTPLKPISPIPAFALKKKNKHVHPEVRNRYESHTI